jgi:cell division protein FtsI (penicillin-binding protein 3)
MFKVMVYLLTTVMFVACSTENTQKTKEAKVKSHEAFQKQLYDLALESSKEYNATATYITVMDSSNGNLVGVVDSTVSLKKYSDDKNIFLKNVLQYAYEPGSVMMPIYYSYALEQNNTTPQDLINCFNGEYKIGSKMITDEHKFDHLSMENVIVYSSNIGIVQVTKDVGALNLYELLKSFGFSNSSIFNYDELGENRGSIPSPEQLKHEIYKATASYGYGIKANLVQLVRAYSVFNNDGMLIYPKDIDTFMGTEYENTVVDEPERVASSKSAKSVKNTLKEVINRGTGIKAKYDSVEVGGKTGTSHMLEGFKYVDKYHSTFVGFANDKENKYIIGVLVVDPKKEYVASKTAAPIFKKVVEILVSQKYLKDNILRFPYQVRE